MNSSSSLGLSVVCALCSAFSALGVTVNDGTTTNNVVQLSNSDGNTAGAVDALTVDPGGYLVAAQSEVVTDFALRTAWYAGDLSATGGVYTVSADFQPAADTYANCGGVIGWLNLGSSNGVALQVTPNDFALSATVFRVSVVDFAALTPNDNDSLNHLYNTDGTPATPEFNSALSAVETNYSATNFATFQLAFSAPSPADRIALSNVIAHITAKVFQGTNAGAPIQVSRTIDLLTDLPLPAPTIHRFGYLAYWGDAFNSGSVIGNLDNLNAEGAVGAAPNLAPTVTITNPTNNATFTEPAAISINADAADNDGTVTRVDFFAGATLLGTATNSPYGFTWGNVSAGNYTLTALVTDNRGGTSTSAPVNISVSGSTGGGPALSIVRAAGAIELSWQSSGYQLQMKTNLSSPTWTDVPGTVTTNHVSLQVGSGNVFFRLVQMSAPGGPKLNIQQSGNAVVISWPAQVSGYRLQAKDSLSSASWTEVSTTGNQFMETPANPARLYRLISP